MLGLLRMDVRGPFYQDKSNSMEQLLGTVIIQTHFIHISVINCILFFSKILGFHFMEFREE